MRVIQSQPTVRRGLLALGRLALIAAVACGFAAADTAFASRGCLADPVLSGRTCSEAECIALQANVNSACKNPAPTSCNRLSGCSVLRREKQKWLNCAVARDTINARCWAGGDPGHQQASSQAWQNVGNCEARIALPEPVGCADPCPQLLGFTANPSSATAGSAPEKTTAAEVAEATATVEAAIDALIPAIRALAEQGALEALVKEGENCPVVEPEATPGAGASTDATDAEDTVDAVER